MSWSNQPKEEPQKKDLATLERNYADAELAYQALKRDYHNVLSQLKATKSTVYDYRQKAIATEEKFEELEERLTEKSAEMQRLLDQNKRYLQQLDHVKTSFEQELTQQVQQAIVPYQQKILRMDRFVEYFPTVLSLGIFGAILYVFFWK